MREQCPRQVLVDRVVEHLENTVVQAALVGRADVHSRALADSCKALEFVDLGSVVLFGLLGKRQIVGHQIVGQMEYSTSFQTYECRA